MARRKVSGIPTRRCVPTSLFEHYDRGMSIHEIAEQTHTSFMTIKRALLAIHGQLCREAKRYPQVKGRSARKYQRVG